MASLPCGTERGYRVSTRTAIPVRVARRVFEFIVGAPWNLWVPAWFRMVPFEMTNTRPQLSDSLARAARRRGQQPLPEPGVRRAIRIASGLTQADLAAVLAVRRPTVSRYESGVREPKGDLRVRYAEALETMRRA